MIRVFKSSIIRQILTDTELDALVNIDLNTRQAKEKHTQLNITRIGTSGSLHADIPVDSFLLSSHALDLNGMLQA